MQAYEEGDQELLEKTVRRQHVSFLDNEVAKLSRTLTVPGEMLSQPTASTTHAPGGYGRQTSPRTQQQPPPPPLSSGMSPAQMRAELYSTPSRPSEKSTPPPQAPVTTQSPPPPPPYAVPQQPPPPTQAELDQEFARLNMNNEKYHPPHPTAQPHQDSYPQQPHYESAPHHPSPPAPHQNPPPKFEEEDDWDDLR